MYLQQSQRFVRDKPISVHIDHFCAQNGINQFLHVYDKWEYNKTESLPLEDYERFDYIMVGMQELKKQKNITNFSKTHKEHFTVDGFHRVSFKTSSKFPFYWPVVHLKTKVMVLKRIE